MIATIQYKDISVLSERNEYLKRLYFLKNAAGRKEIYDRINMLADFYNSTILLRFEHPLMIITNTKKIFVKRLRRMKKMIASDCSSDESSSQEKSNQCSEQISFQSSGFLESIKTRELSSSNSGKHNESSRFLDSSQQFSGSIYDIYTENAQLSFPEKKMIFQLTESIDQRALKNKQSQFDYPESLKVTVESLDSEEQSISHLIIDIDDISREKTLKYYKKLEQRDKGIFLTKKNNEEYNLVIELKGTNQKNARQKSNSMKEKKPNIIITPIDYYLPNDVNQTQSSFSKEEKYYPKMAPNFRKIPKKADIHRYHKQEYDETIKVGDRYPKSSRIYESPNQRHFLNINSNTEEQLPRAQQLRKKKIYDRQCQKQTEKEYISMQDRYEISGAYNSKNIYRNNQDVYNRTQRGPSRTGLMSNHLNYLDEPTDFYINESDPTYFVNNRWSETNYYDDSSQFQSAYEQKAVPIKQLSKGGKKECIRERALALLHKVKSHEKLEYRPSRTSSRIRGYD